ncbi:hypothetical protein lbkm_3732 [Lachnospiraceae bacterium KM106-2]|nr:hypothetical protein lbkm_3732 [Lachnospiraceae bacterium KM106-2]
MEGIIIVNANQKPKSNADYVIILGAKVRGTTITKSLKARLDTAYDYLIENPNTVAIVSGGKGPGEDISEAAAMEKYLKQKGIDKKRIQLEDKSVNTHQNIKFSRRIAQNDDASFVVVTNGFHIYRATRIARKQGLKRVEGLSAPCDKIMLISYYVREGFAVVKYKLSGMI